MRVPWFLYVSLLLTCLCVERKYFAFVCACSSNRDGGYLRSRSSSSTSSPPYDPSLYGMATADGTGQFGGQLVHLQDGVTYAQTAYYTTPDSQG